VLKLNDLVSKSLVFHRQTFIFTDKIIMIVFAEAAGYIRFDSGLAMFDSINIVA
jgi:hypothetical protein